MGRRVGRRVGEKPIYHLLQGQGRRRGGRGAGVQGVVKTNLILCPDEPTGGGVQVVCGVCVCVVVVVCGGVRW